MSGPIVRKYGFPNFDKIFGPRPVQHGADEDPGAEDKGDADKAPATAEAEPREDRPPGEAVPPR